MVFPLSDTDLRKQRRPLLNISLIGLSAVVFVYELMLSTVGRVVFFYQFGLIPAEIVRGISYQSLTTHGGVLDITSTIPTWATMFTSMFIHGDWMHFAANMLFLWVFGDNIEDRFGHLKYLLFYLAAGIAAVGLQIVADTGSEVPTIGASGAIAGVLGAYLVLFPRSRIKSLVVFFFITVIQIRAIYLLGFWFLLQFIGGVGSLGPSVQPGGVAYWAHVGGFVLGVGVAALYRLFTRGSPRGLWPEESAGARYWRGRRL